MRVVFEKLHLVVEPGGAVALAAVIAGKIQPNGNTAITLSGGNVDLNVFMKLLSQAT
jgi:threonine dehydratase